MRLLRCVGRVVDRISHGVGLAAGIVTLVLFGLIIIEVLMRYVVHLAFTWVFDVAELSLLLIFFLPAAMIACEGGHIRVELVTDRLHGKTRYIVELVTYLLSLLFAVLIMWRGLVAFSTLRTAGSLTMAGGVPLAPAVFFVFLGGLFYTLQLLVQIVKLGGQLKDRDYAMKAAGYAEGIEIEGGKKE